MWCLSYMLSISWNLDPYGFDYACYKCKKHLNKIWSFERNVCIFIDRSAIFMKIHKIIATKICQITSNFLWYRLIKSIFFSYSICCWLHKSPKWWQGCHWKLSVQVCSLQGQNFKTISFRISLKIKKVKSKIMWAMTLGYIVYTYSGTCLGSSRLK